MPGLLFHHKHCIERQNLTPVHLFDLLETQLVMAGWGTSPPNLPFHEAKLLLATMRGALWTSRSYLNQSAPRSCKGRNFPKGHTWQVQLAQWCHLGQVRGLPTILARTDEELVRTVPP